MSSPSVAMTTGDSTPSDSIDLRQKVTAVRSLAGPFQANLRFFEEKTISNS